MEENVVEPFNGIGTKIVCHGFSISMYKRHLIFDV